MKTHNTKMKGKKVLSLLLALIMVLSVGSPAFSEMFGITAGAASVRANDAYATVFTASDFQDSKSGNDVEANFSAMIKKAKENGCDEPNEALVDALAKDIFEGGNLGQKSDDRSHEAMILPKYGDSEHKEKSNSKRFIAYVNQTVKNNWKSAEKNKLLLPVGWVYFGGRYVFRSLKGERPQIKVNSFISEAKQRTELFDKLKLFEKE